MYNEYMTKLQLATIKAKCKIHDFFYEENGEVNIIAMIIIMAIAIALAIVFRTQLKSLFNSIWSAITQNTNDALANY